MADGPASKPYYEPSIPFADQRSGPRARASEIVGGNLDHSHGVWRFGSSKERPIQLYVLEDFLTAEECGALATRIDEACFPSPLYEKEKYEGVRTSQTCNFDVHDPLIAQVEERISALLGIERVHGEPLQGQKYAVGQEFRDHADFFYVDQPYWKEYEPHGGQRTWTAMAFLVTPERGGDTRFPLLDLNVGPKLGRLLIWNNMALDGSPNPWTLHAGRPVEVGTKYIFTKWFRERPFA
jgi:prolyl 4-hydroxylase